MAPLLRQKKLWAWYQKHKRDLPWRKTNDPYRIWVSEVMLQQTQVATVIPYYKKFIKRFPTIRHLAEAKEEEVLSHWSGLGYYRRARHLHQGAKQALERHGKFPQTKEDISGLSGIGPYTLGAIMSIAYNQPMPIVDGNVRRVFARWHAKANPDTPWLWKQASKWVGEAGTMDPGDLNQSLMELGAMVCTPKLPGCRDCPVSAECRGRNHPERFPVRVQKLQKKETWHALILKKRNKIGMVQSQSRLFQGLWNVPMFESEDALRIHASDAHHLGHLQHTLTHKKMLVEVYVLPMPVRSPSSSIEMEGLKFFNEGERNHVGVSNLFIKIAGLLDG